MSAGTVKRRAVVDTVALVSYFSSLFGEKSKISHRSIALIEQAFLYESEVLLSIPSVVFIEIFDKWVRDEEFRAKFRSEVLELVIRAPNIEIRPVDLEVLEKFTFLNDADVVSLEYHDKLILASAAVLNWPLITSDPKIKDFADKYQIVPILQ